MFIVDKCYLHVVGVMFLVACQQPFAADGTGGTGQKDTYSYVQGKGTPQLSNLSNTLAAIALAQEKLTSASLSVDDPARVRVLIYGQSLCSQDKAWVPLFEQKMIQHYGDIFTFSDLARPGWYSLALVGKYGPDVQPFKPDLVIIHDYEYDDETYQTILFKGYSSSTPVSTWWDLIDAQINRTNGSNQSASYNLLTQLDYTNSQTASYPGLRTMISSRGRCVEVLLINDYYNSSDDSWSDLCSWTKYPAWAQGAGIALLDMRTNWGNYIRYRYGDPYPAPAGQTLLPDRSQLLLPDLTHQNALGNQLWAYLVLSYFQISSPVP